MPAGLTSSEHALVFYIILSDFKNNLQIQRLINCRLDLGIYHLYSLLLFIKYLCVREGEYARSDWSKTYAGLLHQKTYRKIKGIQTTSRKQNRLITTLESRKNRTIYLLSPSP